MVDATSAGATPVHRGLPEEIVVWEILVRLPPKPLLRCHAVCRAWRRATSTREFLLAHHSRQPSLPLAANIEYNGSHIFTFDHHTGAQLHTVAQFHGAFSPAACCDGLLVLSSFVLTETCFSICNPATRQYAPLGRAQDLRILGMYPYRPTGEYRLLLHRRSNRRWMLTDLLPEGETGCYVFALGSDQPPRYIGWPEIGPKLPFDTPTLVRGSLHWFLFEHQSESRLVIVFNTIAESFRQMRAPAVSAKSNMFEMDGTLGICTNNSYTTKNVDIWALQSYESEVWYLKYRIKLPVEEICGRFEGRGYLWDVKAFSGHGDVLLLVSFGWWLLHIDSDGKLVGSCRMDRQGIWVSNFLLKQTLVQHTFFYGARRSYYERFAFQLTIVEWGGAS